MSTDADNFASVSCSHRCLQASGTETFLFSSRVSSLDLTSPLQDATTNPSLILAAAGKAGYAKLIDTAVAYAKEKGGDINAQVENATDRLVSETDGLAAGRI